MLLELNIKTTKDLEKYLEILKHEDYSVVSTTSKKGNMDLGLVLNCLNRDNLTITPTFSCSSNYNKNADLTYNNFLNFIQILKQHNIHQLLLVSGNPKMKLDTIKVLQQFNDSRIKIAVAYNPYSKNLEIENQRLIAKLQFMIVNQVWLQLGQDVQKLQASVQFIKNINPNIIIVNSILAPTTNLLKSLQFRPWSGVYYSDQFYNDINFALQSVQEMKDLSQELNLEILINGR